MTADPTVRPDLRTGRLIAFFAQVRLSPAHRRIANYITANAETSIFLSSNDLASRVGVSQPSVTRLAASMGCQSFGAFQDEVRSIVLGMDDDTPEGGNKLQSAIADEITHLEALSHLFENTDAINGLAVALMGSRPLVVLGLRSATSIATYFTFFASKIHHDVRYAGGLHSPTRDVLLQGRETGAEWLLTFVLPRYPTEMIQHVAFAKKLGYRIATVTDRPGNHVDDAEQVILAPVGSRLVFDSYAAPLLVANILLEAMSDAEPRQVQERLEEFDSLASQTKLFTS